jgi:hypothetical protein
MAQRNTPPAMMAFREYRSPKILAIGGYRLKRMLIKYETFFMPTRQCQCYNIMGIFVLLPFMGLLYTMLLYTTLYRTVPPKLC